MKVSSKEEVEQDVGSQMWMKEDGMSEATYIANTTVCFVG